MKLDDLRGKLAEFDHLPGDMEVVLAKDGEGSSFSLLNELEEAMYEADSTYSGEHYPTEEQRLACEHSEEYDPAPETAQRAVFLWPVN